jgi:hypothetical protein
MVDDRTRLDRVAVVREAHLVNGRIWPNGLGFDRQGWEYCCNLGTWSALYRRTGLYGTGTTPNLARQAATR